MSNVDTIGSQRESVPDRHSIPMLLAMNVVALVIALWVGYRLYRGSLIGIGDDWNLLEPTSISNELKLIKIWYFDWNGKVGQALPLVILRVPIRVFHWGPESFPFWIPLSTALFGAIAAPLNFLFAARPRQWDVPLGIVAILLLGMWAANRVVYETTLQTAQGISYAFPVYLLSVIVAFYAVRPSRPAPFLVCLALAYVWASLSSEQVLPAVTVLFIAIALLDWLHGAMAMRQFATHVVLWIGLTLLSALLFTKSPGQIRRNPLVGVKFPTSDKWVEQFVTWYGAAVRAGYEVILGRTLPFAPILHTILLLILSIAVLGVIAVRRHSVDPLLLREGILGIAFLLSFLASLSHLFVSPYFPDRARMIPSLLLAVGLALSFLFFLRLLSHARGERVVAIIVFVALLPFVVLPNLEASVNSYRYARWLSSIRVRAYSAVLQQVATHKGNKFRLARCPLELDKSWGYDGYMKWSGHPNVRIVQDGNNGDMDPFGADANTWVIIPCSVPPLLPADWNPRENESPVPFTRSFAPHLVRLTCESGKDHRVYDFDYWLPKPVIRCSASGAFNAAGGGPYQETFDYVYTFGSRQDAAHVNTVRAIRTQEVGGVRYGGTNVSAGYAYNGQFLSEVPVDAFSENWEKRPLFRIRIDIPAAGWPNDQPAIQCR